MEKNNKQEGKLEGILSLATGLSLAFFHQTQMYNLMEKAGLFTINEFGEYANLASDGLGATTAVSAGCISGHFRGLYIGSRFGRFLDKEIYKIDEKLKQN